MIISPIFSAINMLKSLLVCAIAASAFADVSHLTGSRIGGSPPIAPSRRLPVSPFPATPSRLPVSPYPATVSGNRPPAILRQAQDIQPDGYQFSYETENGIAAEERAQIRQVGRDEVEKTAQGSYSWTSPEGERISVAYLADGNGYQPQGSHLPVAPPIPAAIQRALDWIAAHPQPLEPVVTAARRIF